MKIGDYVKVVRQGERFWVLLTKVGAECEGKVDNHLLFTEKHGLSLGNTVKFPRNQIVDHRQN